MGILTVRLGRIRWQLDRAWSCGPWTLEEVSSASRDLLMKLKIRDRYWLVSETTKLFDLIPSSHKTGACPGLHSISCSVSRVKQTAKRLTMPKERGRKLSLHKDPARGRPSCVGGGSSWDHTGSVILIGILSCLTMLLIQQALDRGTRAAGLHIHKAFLTPPEDSGFLQDPSGLIICCTNARTLENGLPVTQSYYRRMLDIRTQQRRREGSRKKLPLSPCILGNVTRYDVR